MNETTPAPVIAIDGPSASGKGTVAALLAKELGFHYLDSGALYRVVVLAAARTGLSLDDEAALARLADGLDMSFRAGEIWLEGEPVSEQVRSEACGNGASKVAAFPAVRRALLERQRAFRRPPGLVADGRDMGSTVFPDAALKVFLTATPEVRAERRYKQLIGKGLCANIGEILQDIRQRDARDSARSVAPLQKCADASLLDTTSLTIEQVVAELIRRCRAARAL